MITNQLFKFLLSLIECLADGFGVLLLCLQSLFQFLYFLLVSTCISTRAISGRICSRATSFRVPLSRPWWSMRHACVIDLFLQWWVLLKKLTVSTFDILKVLLQRVGPMRCLFQGLRHVFFFLQELAFGLVQLFLEQFSIAKSPLPAIIVCQHVATVDPLRQILIDGIPMLLLNILDKVWTGLLLQKLLILSSELIDLIL